MQVNLIAAVGNQGQIGLDGKLPWHDREDLKWFRELTTGGVLVVGMNTIIGLPYLPEREIRPYIREYATPLEFLARTADKYPGRTIWIAGGAKTYATFLPFINRFYISRINYDGPADTFMPSLWNQQKVNND